MTWGEAPKFMAGHDGRGDLPSSTIVSPPKELFDGVSGSSVKCAAFRLN
jgi:hypothetical protein